MSGDGSRRWLADLVFAASLAVVFGYAIYAALGFAENTKLFPLAIAIPSFLLALGQVALSLRARGGAPAERTDADEPDALAPSERTRRTAIACAWVLGMFAAVYLLGFLVAIPLAALAYLRLGARERWAPSIGVGAFCWALVYGLFDRVLHVPLPPGVLLSALGVS